MLNWDEDVKPASQAPLSSGLPGSREGFASSEQTQFAPAARLAQVSAPAAMPAPAVSHAPSAASSAQATSHRRVVAADKVVEEALATATAIAGWLIFVAVRTARARA